MEIIDHGVYSEITLKRGLLTQGGKIEESLEEILESMPEGFELQRSSTANIEVYWRCRFNNIFHSSTDLRGLLIFFREKLSINK